MKREDDYREFLEKAISQAEDSGNDRARCFLLSNHCGSLIYSGQYDAAIKISLDSLEEARRINDGGFFPKSGADYDLGPIIYCKMRYFKLRQPLILAHCDPFDETRIEEMMEQAAALAERGDSPWMKVSHHMARARIGLKLGRILLARNALAKARTLHLEVGLEEGTGELRSVEKALEEADSKTWMA